MKIKRFRIWAMCILIFVSFTLTGVSADNLKSVTIISAPPGGTQYPLSVAFMDIAQKIPGVTATVDASSGGAEQNLVLINMGEADLGISTPGAAALASQGLEFFEGRKCDNIRSVLYLSSYVNFLQIVTFADSPIMELADFDGRRIVAGLAGGGYDVPARAIFKILGIKPKIINVDISDGADMLKDHRVDGLFIIGGAPNTTLMDLEVFQKIKLVPISKENIEKIMSEMPWELCNIPAGVYKCLDQDFLVLGRGNGVYTRKDVPAEFIYDFLEAVFKNQEILKNAHPVGAPLYKQDAVKLYAPLHAGALKYYKDNGIDIPESLILSE